MLHSSVDCQYNIQCSTLFLYLNKIKEPIFHDLVTSEHDCYFRLIRKGLVITLIFGKLSGAHKLICSLNIPPSQLLSLFRKKPSTIKSLMMQ